MKKIENDVIGYVMTITETEPLLINGVDITYNYLLEYEYISNLVINQ